MPRDVSPMLHGPTRLREACPVEAAALQSKRKFPIGLSWAPSLRVVMIGKHAEHRAVHPAAKQPVRASDAEDVGYRFAHSGYDVSEPDQIPATDDHSSDSLRFNKAIRVNGSGSSSSGRRSPTTLTL